MKNVVTIDNIWKKYKIGTPKKLTEAIPNSIRRIGFPFAQKKNLQQKEFWALKGINLEIREGEIVGIVGPNGSGKSTLLKSISGITYPTKGSIEVIGKVASLLELGAGFHPELTGRENIFLYGAVLGINKSQIEKQFSNIITFAGINEFLDTPIKHYSSGMYVRLAFSVAIHLDFDLLLIDEVLTVGDAEFQKKSLEKVQDLVKQRKTVIIVSHDLSIIPKLCKRVIYIQGGQIKKDGKAQQVINYYLKQSSQMGL